MAFTLLNPERARGDLVSRDAGAASRRHELGYARSSVPILLALPTRCFAGAVVFAEAISAMANPLANGIFGQGGAPAIFREPVAM
ncbi:hypothetical protein CLV78_101739 [Aliiruegeria haliotis]|uniref:Uncharacterized protein n=1 Tax=Aliiruegeria haliotis TaxID=1280846 RepID=A0A2T0RZN2_9RHOB|nr:hypothetical protein CLV78_101739 [Aliiruegeria haliotis]